MERFARPIIAREGWLFPDTVLGTDSHTTMVNGIGTLGWGVGGLEAMASMMGQPIGLRMPRVLGLRLTGEKRAGVQASDIALSLAEILGVRGVVDHVLEVFGPGAATLSAEDRATIANMSPEYGATATFFPPDERSLNYFARQGKDAASIALARRYMRHNGIWAEHCETVDFDDRMEFDLSRCVPTAAGPTRPDQRCDLDRLGTAFSKAFPDVAPDDAALKNGDIVLAAITSCTNTANPEAMITASLVARRARQYGLTVHPRMKCTMALGSTSVGKYLDQLGLLEDLQALGFHIDGYGCGACVGNAGPLSADVEAELAAGRVTAVAVLSGNRNFPGRIHPHLRANFLTSPAGVVVLALAGHIRSDLAKTPVGRRSSGRPVMLADLWPADREIRDLTEQIASLLSPISEVPDAWTRLDAPEGPSFPWDATSSYLVDPPFLDLAGREAGDALLSEAAPLLMLGDGITTDHISPVGRILASSDAGEHLASCGIVTSEFNTYGARRGNHEIMVRGTFANPRLQNKLASSTGPWTRVQADGGDVSVFEAAKIHSCNDRQMVVIAGKNYGAGSARDWAAKGTRLLGIRAVIAESFERIHRANLICAGVLPIEVEAATVFPCETDLRLSLPVTWAELTPRAKVEIHVGHPSRPVAKVPAIVRVDTVQDVEILKRGGLLPVIYKGLPAAY
jgi:aconitate hydratase